MSTMLGFVVVAPTAMRILTAAAIASVRCPYSLPLRGLPVRRRQH